MHRGKGMKFVGDSRVPAVRKPNIPKDYSEYPGKTEAFWPNFLLKEWMVGSVFLIGFLCLTVAHPSPLERIADPTDTSYIPLPDWYFLFLYQLLKYSFASGPYTVVGAIIIPGLAFGALLLAPFLDRGPERRPSKRPVAVGMMLLTLAAIIFLTWESVVTHDWEAAAEQGKIRAEVDIDKNAEGYKILEANTCLTCHGENLQGGPAAPSLVGTGLSPEEVINIVKNGQGSMPAGIFKGTDEELQKLAEFVAGLKAE
ncbi:MULTISPECIES: menaquinol-cytochrome c reductase cytochrome b/c subunit [Anoxybacillus]|uniref:Menaquinol:cytochrome c reductase cytochrome c subunit n=1 Tax=Anoxybacillus ayderensis TaxID=265546 RepID=A0A0D0G6D9_9BACL|nr:MULTISPECIES: menaquinol-cytochrome c reductase cytochrome b/c subunit [Anoxybacillus]KHF30708.1 Cytochrome c-551 precursor [Anoxybacillus sp. BCO1]EPZ38406.1 menaquinol-cytochrome c reductase cytochrome b/c subunit [Anoxybacillus ayderensis]KIP20895.1 Cytochrome c551 [Anoxybacillus ayderensis]MED0657616.1 c-type cytochrome [Anoxybacillus ayderensis]NNU96590.1 cytochrome C oxidase Cbb3 [Anoxybacillus sp. EFIL]